MRCSLCAHIEPPPATFSKKSKNLTNNFWRPRAPHLPTGAFIACARLLHAVRRISRPKRVLWVCFGATFALLNRLQQQRSGSAAQQVSSTDHPTPGKLRKAITSSPAVGTTSSVINQTARRHIRLPRRPRPTAAVVIMARLILALVLALAIAGAWCTFPSGGVNVFAPFAVSNSHEPPAPSRPRRLPVAARGVGAVYGAFTRAYKCGASGSCAQGRRAHFRRSRPAPI